MEQAKQKEPIVKVESSKKQNKWWVYSAAAVFAGYVVSSDQFRTRFNDVAAASTQSVEGDVFKQTALETINFSLKKLTQNNQLLSIYEGKARNAGITAEECSEASQLSSLSDEYQKTAKQANALLFLADKIDKKMTDEVNKDIDAVYNKSFPLAMSIHARCIGRDESVTKDPDVQNNQPSTPESDGPRGQWWGNLDGLRI